MKWLKLFSQVGVISLCFLFGIFGTPMIRSGYAKLFPEPEFTVGNFVPLQQKAGASVVVFTTATCPFCEKTRVMLRQKNVEFVEYLIDSSEDHKSLFAQYQGKGVPLLLIGDRRIEGFRESTINDALQNLTASAHRGS